MSGEQSSPGLVPLVDAEVLRSAGLSVPFPCRVVLDDGRELHLLTPLRILPGKRVVGEGQFEGLHVLAKLFIAQASERHWRREVEGVAALVAASIPVPAVLATGTLAGGGHVLLIEFIPNARSLADCWSTVVGRPVGDKVAQAILAPALAMLARMHAAGLVQGDLHLGNFLQQGEVLFVIDGDSVSTAGRSLKADEAAANLGMLLAQLPVVWDTLAETLLSCYMAAGGITIDVAFLQAEITRVRAWRVRDYLAKSVRECTLFSVTKHPTRFISVLRASLDHLRQLIDDLDTAISAGTQLKSGNTCTVAKVSTPAGNVVIKRYNLKNFSHAMSRLWRPSRAWHSWREGHRLALYGIATPAPLALVEERIGPLRRRAWLVNEFCSGPNLGEHLVAVEEPPAAEAVAIAELFATLARLRISHGDLKATNLLWHAGQVWMIDLDACTQHNSDAAWRKAWRRDRARLLRNWSAESVLGVWLQKNLPPA